MGRKVIRLATTIDPTQSWPAGWRILLYAIVVVAASALFMQNLLAVHDAGAIQLEGNARRADPALPSPFAPDDWDNVCHQVVFNATAGSDAAKDAAADAACGDVANTSGATAVSWTADNLLTGVYSTAATIFTGGGSKDPQPISAWAWKDGAGGLPDKDNLVHAFAARYSFDPSATCPAGSHPTCELLFFGSDRFDNSGDAHQAFWFLQDPVGLGTNQVGGGSGFTGEHRLGDLLVISAFSNGGTVSTISIYQWNPAVSGNLELLETSGNANCLTAQVADPFCGIVNGSNGTAAPWAFVNKTTSDPANTYLAGEFFEAAVNLSTLGLANRCFSTIVSETRSSTSTTAQLKDFVIAPLGQCDTTLTTTPLPSTTVSIGTGSVPVQDSATIVIDGISAWSGTLKFFLCSPADLAGPPAQATCVTGGTQIGPVAGVVVTNATTQPILSVAATITAAGYYCWRGEFEGDETLGIPSDTDASAGECFTVTPANPAITTAASAQAPTGVPLGSEIWDIATLGGTATPSNAVNGTITFSAYGPFATQVDVVCTGTAAYTATVNVTGIGNYDSRNNTVLPSPSKFIPASPGIYGWQASYTPGVGDVNNTSASHPCGLPVESSLIIRLDTTIATTQFFYPNDRARIQVASTAGGALQGSVNFKLFNNSGCSAANGGQLLDLDVDLTAALAGGNAQDKTVETSNYGPTGVRVTPDTIANLYWLVTFTSTNAAHNGAVSECGREQAVITVNNNYTPPTP